MPGIYEVIFPEGYRFIGSTEGSFEDSAKHLHEMFTMHSFPNKIYQACWDKFKEFQYKTLETCRVDQLAERSTWWTRKRKEEAHPHEVIVIRPKGWADQNRPEWHKWVYGGYDNPLYERNR